MCCARQNMRQLMLLLWWDDADPEMLKHSLLWSCWSNNTKCSTDLIRQHWCWCHQTSSENDSLTSAGWFELSSFDSSSELELVAHRRRTMDFCWHVAQHHGFLPRLRQRHVMQSGKLYADAYWGNILNYGSVTSLIKDVYCEHRISNLLSTG